MLRKATAFIWRLRPTKGQHATSRPPKPTSSHLGIIRPTRSSLSLKSVHKTIFHQNRTLWQSVRLKDRRIKVLEYMYHHLKTSLLQLLKVVDNLWLENYRWVTSELLFRGVRKISEYINKSSLIEYRILSTFLLNLITRDSVATVCNQSRGSRYIPVVWWIKAKSWKPHKSRSGQWQEMFFCSKDSNPWSHQGFFRRE